MEIGRATVKIYSPSQNCRRSKSRIAQASVGVVRAVRLLSLYTAAIENAINSVGSTALTTFTTLAAMYVPQQTQDSTVNHGCGTEVRLLMHNIMKQSDPTKNAQNTKRAGRRPVHIDLVELEKLAGLQCTDNELASWFEVDPKTIARKKKTDPKFRETLDRGRARGRVSIRRMLFQTAQAGKQGSVAAAIFLAKNILGYRDAGIGDEGTRPADPQEALNAFRALYGLAPLQLNTSSPSPESQPRPTSTVPEKTSSAETQPTETPISEYVQ